MRHDDDVLIHYGVKGMKWGIRRKRGSDGTVTGKKPGRIKRTVDTAKHDLSKRKQLKNVKNMSNEELRSMTNRMQNENDLKRLAGKKSKGKDLYLKGTKMTDAELKTRVERMQLESNLRKQVKTAEKPYKDAAKKVMKGAADIALDIAGDKFAPTGDKKTDALIKTVIKASLADKNNRNDILIKGAKKYTKKEGQ